MRSLLKKRPVWIIAGALFVTLLMIFGRSRDDPPPRPERAVLVDVIAVDRQTLRPTLDIFGSVQSPQDAELSAGIAGLVDAVAVRDGATVAEDELLVQIDPRDAELKLKQEEANQLEVEAQLRSAELRLKRDRLALEKETELVALIESRQTRAQELAEQNLLSQADLETADENLKRQQLALSQAELAVAEGNNRVTELRAQRARAIALRDQAALDVERSQVTAPFPGVVSELEVSEGDRVSVGDPLMRLQNPAAIEVRAQIPAAYAEMVDAGLGAGTAMNASVQAGEQRIPGRIVRLSGQTQQSSGGVDSFIGFNAPPRSLRLGTTVAVRVELPPVPDVTAVPAEAIYGRNQLYKVVDSRMQMVEFERVGERIGPDGRNEVLLRSPQLQDEEQVIITKLANAADGLLVKINEPEPSARTEQTARSGTDL
ncbi:MAG: HlyD family efflux transporter periplasmic adaptor subunit [Gammaproteobacteria bacterium]|nr:HlyD family efflux transporter periplasmic adaptor subunit [Gammaproteobacteria bacterium]